MSDIMRDLVAIAMALIGLAMLAVVIKSNNTVGVINASTSGFSSLLKAASAG